jgi:hypothetical protein
METDKRKHVRLCPDNFLATITLIPQPPEKQISFDGTVVDISYDGIKIKLDKPITANIEKAEINIDLKMPGSGVPLTIKGNIKHLCNKSEYGLQYSEENTGSDIEHLMFECTRASSNKSQPVERSFKKIA